MSAQSVISCGFFAPVSLEMTKASPFWPFLCHDWMRRAGRAEVRLTEACGPIPARLEVMRQGTRSLAHHGVVRLRGPSVSAETRCCSSNGDRAFGVGFVLLDPGSGDHRDDPGLPSPIHGSYRRLPFALPAFFFAGLAY